MMPNKIKQLKIIKFRGATDKTTIEFDCQKRIFVVFGENGTGKTTILDAIDFACNKNSEVSLKNISVGANKHKYLPSMASQPGSLEVEIETDNTNRYSAKFGSRGEVNVRAGLPQVKILRRDSILKIVTEQPKERFEEIRGMVSYPKIKQMEDALREAKKNIDKIYEDALKAYQQEDANIKNAWDGVGDKTQKYLLWAQERSSVCKSELEKDQKTWAEISKKGEELTAGCERLCQYQIAHRKAKDAYSLKEIELNKKLIGEAEKGGLVPLLEKAKSYIEGQSSLSECPVCKGKIEKDNLIADINSRIESMKDLKEIQDGLAGLKKERETREGQIASENQNIDKLIEEIRGLFNDNQAEGLKELQDILNNIDGWATIASEKQKEYNQLELIQRTYKAYIEKKEEAEKSGKEAEKTKKLLGELEEIRKIAVDNDLASISSSVERMYSQVHPGEGIGSVRFYLDPHKSESLEYEGLFQGESVPPQAYYSESHLDTLGICVFLALSQYNCNNGIILLDDVLTSADQQHMNRLIDMLEVESKNYDQIIIATHYRPWRERYRMPINHSNDVQLIELLPWTTESGIRHTRTKFFVDEIRESIAEKLFDRQKVASKAGILLEHILDELALKYALRVPRKSMQKYTLGELFNAMDARFRKCLNVLKGSDLPVTLQPYLDNLQNTVFVRNDVGCHYDYSGSGVLLSDSDVREFGGQVVAFADMLLCDSCGAFPNKNKSGSYWECNCGSLKLQPLQRP